ncbi:MAG: hypothetical protein AAF125_16615 [Chloroflexota bacterium]
MFDNEADALALGATWSYERWGACRGTNIGAALREANNALVDPLTTRQEGAVWVIVFLSDGAAGATDPIPFDDTGSANFEADPYNRVGNVYDPNVGAAPIASVYGEFGFCPWGTPTDPTGFTESDPADGNRNDLIYCLDRDPNSRHACNTNASGNDVWTKESDDEINGVLQQRITNNAREDVLRECEEQYDADDYARDWADYVAMDRQLLSGEQLPTIFTIGFNLDYPVTPTGGETLCEANMSMCLGEELLRYIANVGDNNEYDVGEYPNTANNAADAGDDYGNYYNAPDQARLSEVFDEIAGKLFTRLAG